MKTSQTKVLFMHGLESGPQGNKSKYLEKHFANVRTPAMKMSVYRFSQKHSVIRNILKNPLSIAHFSVIALAVYLNATAKISVLTLSMVLVTCFISLFILKKHIISQSLAASLQQCFKVQSKAIKEYQPDIIMGSSWGGLIALLCVARGIYSGPLFLIAPPITLVLSKIDSNGILWKQLCSISTKTAQKIHIVHGSHDEIVAIQSSQKYAQITGVALETVPRGDHSLNSALIDDIEGEGENLKLKNSILALLQR